MVLLDAPDEVLQERVRSRRGVPEAYDTMSAEGARLYRELWATHGCAPFHAVEGTVPMANDIALPAWRVVDSTRAPEDVITEIVEMAYAR